MGGAGEPVVDLATIQLSCQHCSLAELCLPRGLAPDEVEELEKAVTPRRPLSRGASLYRPGDRFASLFAVKSGTLKSMITTADGEEQVVGFHMPGELLGLDGLNTEKHTCTAIALERSTVCELPFVKIEEICRRHPALQREMCSLLGKEINDEQAMLLLLAKRTAEERLASFLVSLSQRYRRRGYSDTEFNLSMSRHDIANYLGLAPETISRLFSRFNDEGLLSVDRRYVRIHALDRLRAMVGGFAGADLLG